MQSLRYPFQAIGGRPVLTSDYPTIVSQTILACLQTYQEERVWRPLDFMPRLVFTSAPDLQAVLRQIQEAVSDGLRSFPDVSFSVLGAVQDDGSLYVSVPFLVPDQEPGEVSIVL